MAESVIKNESRMDVLFSGNASTPDSVIQLSGNISDYKKLVIFYTYDWYGGCIEYFPGYSDTDISIVTGLGWGTAKGASLVIGGLYVTSDNIITIMGASRHRIYTASSSGEVTSVMPDQYIKITKIIGCTDP